MCLCSFEINPIQSTVDNTDQIWIHPNHLASHLDLDPIYRASSLLVSVSSSWSTLALSANTMPLSSTTAWTLAWRSKRYFLGDVITLSNSIKDFPNQATTNCFLAVDHRRWCRYRPRYRQRSTHLPFLSGLHRLWWITLKDPCPKNLQDHGQSSLGRRPCHWT
jgi:hypothetical protein